MEWSLAPWYADMGMMERADEETARVGASGLCWKRFVQKVEF